jgi:hypothetical protein
MEQEKSSYRRDKISITANNDVINNFVLALPEQQKRQRFKEAPPYH